MILNVFLDKAYQLGFFLMVRQRFLDEEDLWYVFSSPPVTGRSLWTSRFVRLKDWQ